MTVMTVMTGVRRRLWSQSEGERDPCSTGPRGAICAWRDRRTRMVTSSCAITRCTSASGKRLAPNAGRTCQSTQRVRGVGCAANAWTQPAGALCATFARIHFIGRKSWRSSIGDVRKSAFDK